MGCHSMTPLVHLIIITGKVKSIYHDYVTKNIQKIGCYQNDIIDKLPEMLLIKIMSTDFFLVQPALDLILL